MSNLTPVSPVQSSDEAIIIDAERCSPTETYFEQVQRKRREALDANSPSKNPNHPVYKNGLGWDVFYSGVLLSVNLIVGNPNPFWMAGVIASSTFARWVMPYHVPEALDQKPTLPQKIFNYAFRTTASSNMNLLKSSVSAAALSLTGALACSAGAEFMGAAAPVAKAVSAVAGGFMFGLPMGYCLAPRAVPAKERE